MIKLSKNSAEWILLLEELNEAQEHLSSLVSDMARNGQIEEDEFAVQLGHIYAHLNRAWFSRNGGDPTEHDQWDSASAFPSDIDIVG